MLRAAFRERLKQGKEEKGANDPNFLTHLSVEFEGGDVQFKKQTSHEDGHEEIREHYESAESDNSDKDDDKIKKHLLTTGSADGVCRESFSNSERSIYEMQLALLQEQLVAAMIQSQEASESRCLEFGLVITYWGHSVFYHTPYTQSYKKNIEKHTPPPTDNI